MEIFIKKFTDVVQANNWNPQVAHLNLGLSIAKQKGFLDFSSQIKLLTLCSKNIDCVASRPSSMVSSY